MGRHVHRPLTAALSAGRSPAPQPATKRRRRCSPPLRAERKRHRGRARRSRDARFHVHGSEPKTRPSVLQASTRRLNVKRRRSPKRQREAARCPIWPRRAAKWAWAHAEPRTRGQVGRQGRPRRQPVAPFGGTKRCRSPKRQREALWCARLPRLCTERPYVPRRVQNKGQDGVPQGLAAANGRQVAEDRARALLVPEIAPPRGQAAFVPRRAAHKGLDRVPEAAAAPIGSAVCQNGGTKITCPRRRRRCRRRRPRPRRRPARAPARRRPPWR